MSTNRNDWSIERHFRRNRQAAHSRVRGEAQARDPSHANNGIVDMPDNRPVMDKKKISHAMQPFQRFMLISAHRLVRNIPACRNDRKSEFSHQQMMERGYGSMTPKIGLCGATEEAMRDFRFAISDFRLRRTIGDSADKRSRSSNFETSHSHFTSSSDGNIIAKGFSSRCFLRRSDTTACSFRASTISWNPPIPLTATIFPARRAAADFSNCLIVRRKDRSVRIP